jgi:hypothetical protein
LILELALTFAAKNTLSSDDNEAIDQLHSKRFSLMSEWNDHCQGSLLYEDDDKSSVPFKEVVLRSRATKLVLESFAVLPIPIAVYNDNEASILTWMHNFFIGNKVRIGTVRSQNVIYWISSIFYLQFNTISDIFSRNYTPRSSNLL